MCLQTQIDSKYVTVLTVYDVNFQEVWRKYDLTVYDVNFLEVYIVLTVHDVYETFFCFLTAAIFNHMYEELNRENEIVSDKFACLRLTLSFGFAGYIPNQ